MKKNQVTEQLKIFKALCMLNSKVLLNERHTDDSERIAEEAIQIVGDRVNKRII